MARRSQCSSAEENPLDPNYLPPHYREEYRLAIDALVEEDLEGYYKFLQKADVVDFLSTPEIQYIQSSVQDPPQSHQPEPQFLETVEDGSSDTYWPIHSDLDVPGLDLGWPQLHHFIGPTEVTTLVNPPEPNMPCIKDQARRLIKNAQQVVAIVMDMFTDVDIFADILNATMRNVAVYILLDEQNAHHFINMVSNCRVSLDRNQFLRVRTVCGATYHCRSGKSFKGQMMDRFLLTDCRAVLSGNYSFMWSYEKLHRCMAHLFLGQLVATFDEEFRILFAQSKPLMIENVHAPIEEFSLLTKSQYPSERMSVYREPRKFMDTSHSEEWVRHLYDEPVNVDRRLIHGPSDTYNRFPSQQQPMDISSDPVPSRMPMMENPPFMHHSYAEGVHGRLSYPFLLQQGISESENQGRQIHRGQQPYPGPRPGTEADYYDKFWSQDYFSADQHLEPGLPQEMQPPDNFDPVLNYLSSTGNLDFDQNSAKLLPAADLPFSSSQPRRLSLGQPYVCQTSPTPSSPADQKPFFQEHSTERKDPVVKRGLRNWRISSYLSGYDNPEDEVLPLGPFQAPDLSEEPSYPIQQRALVTDLSIPKIPNVKEFKVPAIPRAGQMLSLAKTTAQEQTKTLPDDFIAVAAEITSAPSPSESSSTTEVEKAEEAEQKEPKMGVLRREESFRRKYNAAAPRCSRLRSSLIFSSLDQETKTAPGQEDEESDKNKTEQTKLPFVSKIFRQRKAAVREPTDWSRYVKSATFDNSATETSKTDDGNSKAEDEDPSKEENSNDLSEKSEDQRSIKPLDVEQSMPQSKPCDTELPKTNQPVQPPTSLLLTSLCVDMNDPDTRLMYFKELAAKRKAAKAAEAEKSQDKAPMKPPAELKSNTTELKEDSIKMANILPSEGLLEKNATAEEVGKTVYTEACETNRLVKNDPSTSQSCEEEQTRVLAESQRTELKSSPSVTSLPTTPTTNSTSKESSLLTSTSVEVPSFSASAPLYSKTPDPQSVQLETNISSPLSPSEKLTRPKFSSSDHIQEDSGLHPPCSSTPLSSPAETISSNVTSEDTSSTLTSVISSTFDKTEAQESANPSLQQSPQPAEETSQNSGQAYLDPVCQLTSSETPSAVDSAHVKSDISHDICAVASEPNTSSLQSTTKTNSEESCALTPSGKYVLTSENSTFQKTDAEEPKVFGSSQDVKVNSTPVIPSSPKSSLSNASGLESSSRSHQNETVPPAPNPVDHPAEHSSLFLSISQSETAATPQDALIQVTPPSEPNMTVSVTPTPAETVLCSSPLTESVGSGLSPKDEKTETNMFAVHNPKQITTDLDKMPILQSKETSSPTELTSKVTADIEVPCKTPKAENASENHPSEPPVPAENSKMDNQNDISKDHELPEPGEKIREDTEANYVSKGTTHESVSSEKTNDNVRQNNCHEPSEITSDEVVPLSPQAKQPKSSQSRYLASTANVLSSSNLRDDTKLLLGQISANCQSRNEATKEAPVTDDEKEDEVDKNAKREKGRGTRTPSREQPKPVQEREKLLERIQSMRKERKVYSRFEV